MFAGVLWAGSGSVFTSFVVSVSRYEAIYSGFAIVIVAMIWLYLSWLILLLGTQLAFYLQNPDYLRLGQRTEVMSNGLRERLALERDAAHRPRFRRSRATAGASRASPRGFASRATCSSPSIGSL